MRARKGILEHVKQEEADPEESENPLAWKMILMAEDIDANAEILADLLDLENISSERAENGKIALEMFSSKPDKLYETMNRLINENKKRGGPRKIIGFFGGQKGTQDHFYFCRILDIMETKS